MIITAVPPFETPNVQAQITLRPLDERATISVTAGQCAAIGGGEPPRFCSPLPAGK